MTTTLVLSTLMSKQPPVCEGGRFGGRQSGRKCGDVDDYLSDHGTFKIAFSEKLTELDRKIDSIRLYKTDLGIPWSDR